MYIHAHMCIYTRIFRNEIYPGAIFSCMLEIWRSSVVCFKNAVGKYFILHSQNKKKTKPQDSNEMRRVEWLKHLDRNRQAFFS